MENQKLNYENIEVTCRKVTRSEYLIASFVNGFAAGWTFAVREAFKDALDIRLTDKMINKQKFKVLTQGQNFDFHEGDIFHNSQLAFSNWECYINNKSSVSLEVKSSSSSGFVEDNVIESAIINNPFPVRIIKNNKVDEKQLDSLKVTNQKYDAGIVTIAILVPSKSTKKLVEKEIIKFKQNELVSLLQKGEYYDKKQKKYIYLGFTKL